MTPAAFKKAMLRGLGRCIIELDENENIEKYRSVVLWGCLHNLSYDTQCEGTRSEYMYILQSKFEDNYFEAKIIEKFLKENRSNSWLFDHYANMLYCFAFDGSEEAHNALYSKYNEMYRKITLSKQYKKLNEFYTQFEWLCIWIVSLDGLSGFKKIVSDIGYAYRKNPIFQEYYTFDWFYAACKSNCGEKRIINYMDKKIKQSEDVRIFYESIKVYPEDNHFNKKQEKVCVNDVVVASKEEWFKCRGTIVRFSYKASDEDLLELARIVMVEPSEDTKANMLWAFKRKGFPLEPNIIIEYSKSENENLVYIAFEILSITKDNIARDYALELIKNNKHLEQALSIVINNYRPEDENIVFSILKKVKVGYNDGKWHGMYIDAINWIQHDKKAPDKIILYLYENTLCSSCREDIVKVMSKRKLLNNKLLKECLYDSNQDIRKFAERKSRIRGT